jgi:hypothetical protein
MDDLDPAAFGRQTRIKWGPWKPDDVTRLVLGQLFGIALMGASWFEAGSQLTVREELTWLNVGLVGLAVCGVGNALWLLQGRRSVGTARVLVLPDRGDRPTVQADADPTVRPDHRVVLKAKSATLYHRPGCPLLVGKPTSATAAREGRAPCQVCQA